MSRLRTHKQTDRHWKVEQYSALTESAIWMLRLLLICSVWPLFEVQLYSMLLLSGHLVFSARVAECRGQNDIE